MLPVLIERSLIAIAAINADSGGSKYRYKLLSHTEIKLGYLIVFVAESEIPSKIINLQVIFLYAFLCVNH